MQGMSSIFHYLSTDLLHSIDKETCEIEKNKVKYRDKSPWKGDEKKSNYMSMMLNWKKLKITWKFR